MNVVAILRSDAAGEALHEACARMNGTRIDVHVGRLADVRPGVDFLKDRDVFILDVDPRDDQEVEHLRLILQTHFPNMPVVATASEVTLREMRRFMRMGVVDFVPQPITPSELESALRTQTFGPYAP